MQVCDLDRRSVKGPSVDATYHVPSAEDLVSSCEFNMHSQLVFHSAGMCYPVFLPSKAKSNLSFCSCCEAVLPLFPCYAVSLCVCARAQVCAGLLERCARIQNEICICAPGPSVGCLNSRQPLRGFRRLDFGMKYQEEPGSRCVSHSSRSSLKICAQREPLPALLAFCSRVTRRTCKLSRTQLTNCTPQTHIRLLMPCCSPACQSACRLP